jgi:hypothetical protein
VVECNPRKLAGRTGDRARLCRGRSTPSDRTGGPPACPSAMQGQPHGPLSCVPRLLRPARHVLGPHRRPSDVPNRGSRTGGPPACRGSCGRPGTSSGRTGGPPTCSTVAAATARLRCGPHRRPSAVPSCRRVRSGREVRPRSPGHGSSGREAHSMSSVSVIMTCSPVAARSAASSSSGW